MNHDSLGFDKAQIDGERRQRIQLLSQQEMQINWIFLILNVRMKYHVFPQNYMFINLTNFASEKVIYLISLLSPF